MKNETNIIIHIMVMRETFYDGVNSMLLTYKNVVVWQYTFLGPEVITISWSTYGLCEIGEESFLNP